MEKIIVFGVGKRYEKFRNVINKHYDVIALVDNFKSMWGGEGKTCRGCSEYGV